MALEAMKQEWSRFTHDRPGERFANHRRRMSHAPRWRRGTRLGAGVTLVVLGIVLVFLPGPGLLAIALGSVLLAGRSSWLAHRMDDGEPRLRAWGDARMRAWRRQPRRTRVVLATAAGVALGLLGMVLWEAMW